MDKKYRRFIIYGLVDPRNGQLRYIGKSVTGLQRPRSKFDRAIKGYEGKTHKSSWIKQLASEGLKYEIVVLQELDDGEGQFGVKFPAERKLKIVRAHGARPFTDENGNMYQSVRQAARSLGTYHNMISQVLKGNRKSIHGHTFKYVE